MKSTFSIRSQSPSSSAHRKDRKVGAYELERVQLLKQISSFVASRYVIPLFLVFGFADFSFYPDMFWEFMVYRLTTVCLIYWLNNLIQTQSDSFWVQVLCTAFILSCSLPLNIMVWRIDDPSSAYFVGLTLVLVGMASGFRFTWKFYFANLALVFFPYFLGALVTSNGFSKGFFLNSLFLLSTGLITSVSRKFVEGLHNREFDSRWSLQSEVESRGRIIEQKTKQAVDLALLSKQFSPQIVDAIATGKLDIYGPRHLSEICVLFVDIVGSTEKFINLPRENIQSILSFYIEDTMSTLLKYDITIDKFLGDGVLAFSNDPVPYNDYVERVLMAAVEMRERIALRSETYNSLWEGDFQVTVGIATGLCNVGFFGSTMNFKSYTAIGTAVNLASRLGTHALPNQILISDDVIQKLDGSNVNSSWFFNFSDMGTVSLKGFEDQPVRVYELKEAVDEASNVVSMSRGNDPRCPDGHGILFLGTDDKGIFIYKCRHCDYVLDHFPSPKTLKKTA